MLNERRPGQNITLENRNLSNESVDKKNRKLEIINILRDANDYLSVREIAYKLFEEKKIPFFERNAVAPRITELCQEGILDPVGDDIDAWTGKKVTLYGFTDDVKKNNYRTIYDEI